MKNLKKELAIAGGSFITGVAVGLVSFEAIRKTYNDLTYSEKTASIRDIKDQQKAFVSTANKRLSELRSRIRKELNHPLPDLYKATENLCLSDQDVKLDH